MIFYFTWIFFISANLGNSEAATAEEVEGEAAEVEGDAAEVEGEAAEVEGELRTPMLNDFECRKKEKKSLSRNDKSKD